MINLTMETIQYYKHFKGGLYQFIALAIDSETLAEMVVYKALYGEQRIWVRPKEMFFGKVVVDGHEVDRFCKITQDELERYLQNTKSNI
ncbi:MAG: DUF1653 domain-containing protein [Marinifilaceae bacterium]